jgi:uncharacterized protein
MTMDTEMPPLIEPPARPWGFWATLGFTALAIVAMLGVEIVVTLIFVVVGSMRGSIPDPHSLESNGQLISVASMLATPVTIGLAVLFAAIRRGITVRQYLALRKPAAGQYFRWIVAILLLAACSDALTVHVLGKPIVPEWVTKTYSTAGFAPLIWLAIVVVAPLGEEFVFRGFLFKGVMASRLGPIGAIVLSSLAWSSLHIQYDLYGVATTFVTGLLLGAARWKSDSLYVPMAMHLVSNLVATVEAAVCVRMMAG